MKEQVENVRNWFNRIYLGGIPLMMKKDTAFLSFICVLTAIEALAGYRYLDEGETASPGERLRRFTRAYFPTAYHALADDLWGFRNGMIHGFVLAPLLSPNIKANSIFGERRRGPSS